MNLNPMFKVKEFSQWNSRQLIHALSFDSDGISMMSDPHKSTETTRVLWSEVQSINIECYQYYGSMIRNACNLVIKTPAQTYRFDLSKDTASTYPKKKLIQSIRAYYHHRIPIFTYHKLFDSHLYQILVFVVGITAAWIGIKHPNTLGQMSSTFLISLVTLLLLLIISGLINYKVEKSVS